MAVVLYLPCLNLQWFIPYRQILLHLRHRRNIRLLPNHVCLSKFYTIFFNYCEFRPRNRLVYIHLPFDQHSRLEVRPGETAREAISKLLRKRNITPQLCRVHVSSDPRSEQIDLQVSQQLTVF